MLYARNLDEEDKPIKVAIVGSRTYLPYWKVLQYMHDHLEDNVVIVSGGADGVDSAAKYAAGVLGLGYKEFLPKYFMYGLKAPLYRNIEIAQSSDMMVAFWDGKSRGTKHALATMRALEKPFVVIGE